MSDGSVFASSALAKFDVILAIAKHKGNVKNTFNLKFTTLEAGGKALNAFIYSAN